MRLRRHRGSRSRFGSARRRRSGRRKHERSSPVARSSMQKGRGAQRAIGKQGSAKRPSHEPQPGFPVLTKIDPRFYTAAGLFIANASYIEFLKTKLLVEITGAHDQAMSALMESIRGSSKRTDAIKAAAEHILEPIDAEALKLLLDVATDIEHHRNRFAHHLWGRVQKHGDMISVMPTDQYSMFTAEIDAVDRRAVIEINSWLANKRGTVKARDFDRKLGSALKRSFKKIRPLPSFDAKFYTLQHLVDLIVKCDLLYRQMRLFFQVLRFPADESGRVALLKALPAWQWKPSRRTRKSTRSRGRQRRPKRSRQAQA